MKTLTPARALLPVLLSAILVTACGSSNDGSGDGPEAPTAPGGSDASEVTVLDFQFSPNVLEIPTGSRVTWKNQGRTAHTTTADGGQWDSGSISGSTPGGGTYDQPATPGGSFTRSFAEPGTYVYHCSFHSNMTGRIIVSD